MLFIVKLVVTNIIIIGCALLSRRFPTMGGLIATMPLTSLLVLLWIHTDDPENVRMQTEYTVGVLWGIIPTALFFAAVYLCFRKQLPFPIVLCAGFAVWLAGAVVHQWLLGWK